MEIKTPISLVLANKGSEVWSINPEATVFDAIALMAERDIGALPVVKNGRLLGLISERDYSRKIILFGRSSRDTPVSEIMTTDLATLTERHSVQEAMELMTEHRIRHIPIMDGETMVGLLSIGDVVNWTISEQKSTISDLERFVTGAYPA